MTWKLERGKLERKHENLGAEETEGLGRGCSIRTSQRLAESRGKMVVHLAYVDSVVKSCRTCSCALGSSDRSAIVLRCMVREWWTGNTVKEKKLLAQQKLLRVKEL